MSKHDRIIYLKELKCLANRFLDQNKDLNNKRKNKWIERVVQNNIMHLKDIIKMINKELSPKYLEHYLEDEKKAHGISSGNSTKGFLFWEIPRHYVLSNLNINHIRILAHSPKFSIEYDLSCMGGANINELAEIALGIKEPEILESYLEHKITYIEDKVLTSLELDIRFKKSSQVSNNAIKHIKEGSYLTANILLITYIEAIIRSFCFSLYEFQHPEKTKEEVENCIYETHTSIESLILKTDWKADIEISLVKGGIMSQHYSGNELNNAYLGLKNIFENEDVLDSGEKQYISLKTLLEPLIRRYKEDRNKIIHGYFDNFDKKWKSYFYLSMLENVYEVIVLYDRRMKA